LVPYYIFTDVHGHNNFNLLQTLTTALSATNNGWMSKVFPPVCQEVVDVPQNTYHYSTLL
jgi:hypothetical protein